MKKINEEFVHKDLSKYMKYDSYRKSIETMKNIDLESFIKVLKEQGESEKEIQKIVTSILRLKKTK